MKQFGYRKLFDELKPFYPKRRDLDKLATIMSGSLQEFSDVIEEMSFENNMFAAAVAREQKHEIPAGYTYLSQFISHDISFDEASDRHRREDFPWDIISQKALKKLKNLRTPFLNLEAVYGNRQSGDKNDPRSSGQLLENYKLPLFRIGEAKGNNLSSGESFPNDLPRGYLSVKAEIVDPRNDENLLLAQTQIAFMKFHNALVVKFKESGAYSYRELFEKARKTAIRYYQTIILTDFLPQIAQKHVLDSALEKLEYEEPDPSDFDIPLEFSVAAFRFGHSMIKNRYNVNKHNSSATVDNMMVFTGRGGMGSNSFATHFALPADWIINWNNFYQIGETAPLTAEPIDTELAPLLLRLIPIPKHLFGGRISSLAALDLYRGRRLGLPCGQDVAQKINVAPLVPEQIAKLIDAKKILIPAPGISEQEVKERLKKTFGAKTPLWFYILAEAEETGRGRLGETGSRIIVETILNLLYYSEYSILQDDWEADEDFLLNETDSSFSMAEMLLFIQKTCFEHFEELYPKKYYPKTIKRFDELNPLEKGYQ